MKSLQRNDPEIGWLITRQFPRAPRKAVLRCGRFDFACNHAADVPVNGGSDSKKAHHEKQDPSCEDDPLRYSCRDHWH
jgi:hypothetical protein